MGLKIKENEKKIKTKIKTLKELNYNYLYSQRLKSLVKKYIFKYKIKEYFQKPPTLK